VDLKAASRPEHSEFVDLSRKRKVTAGKVGPRKYLVLADLLHVREEERRFVRNISSEPAHVLATASGAETIDGTDESGS
jgi:hypothetical protein